MLANMLATCCPDKHMSVVLTPVLTCQHPTLPAKVARLVAVLVAVVVAVAVVRERAVVVAVSLAVVVAVEVEVAVTGSVPFGLPVPPKCPSSN